jgi:outer membrane protein insertion porin family
MKMGKTTGLIIALLFVGGFAAAAAPARSPSADAPSIITAVEITGNKLIPEKEISDVIFTRVGDTLVDEKTKADLKAVYALGYFSDVNSSVVPGANGSKLIIKVVENPKIEGIFFEGNTVFSTAELSSRISTRQGEVLSYKKMQDDIETVNTLYKSKGYIMARVVDVETDQKTSTLHFKIIEGMVESISLDGNDNTQDYVILRELKTRPGSVLNEEVLKKDLRRVFNLGFFSEVTPNFEPGSSKDRVVLQLKIKETRTSTINFGGGYGEREGWFGFVDLSINNLKGTGQGLLIRGQSGQELSTYQFKYFNPWFWPEKMGDHAALTLRRWLTIGRDVFLTDQNAKYNGFDVALGKPLSDYYNVTYTLGTENVDPYGVSSFESYLSNTVGVTLSFDTRDFWLNPKEGRYYTLDVKQGWKYAASANTNFFKFGWDINHYYPVFSNQVAAFHIGTGLGYGDVPIGEIYWAGGANTIRGFYPSEARRGKKKLIMNAEYRLNFSDLFQGVFFYDLGNAWDYGWPDSAQFISGWGPGVRINTPLGPIRLDYGVPGGKSFGEGIMHFSIGQAF